METSDLIARASAGDHNAFRDLVEVHSRELQVHCYRILGSLQDAEDALQETLVSAWRNLGDFGQRSSLRTWLYQIATNRCLSMLRADSRRPRTATPLPDADPARADRRQRRSAVAGTIPGRAAGQPRRPGARSGDPLRDDRGDLARVHHRLAATARRGSAPYSCCATCWATARARWPGCSTPPRNRFKAPSNEHEPRSTATWRTQAAAGPRASRTPRPNATS